MSNTIMTMTMTTSLVTFTSMTPCNLHTKVFSLQTTELLLIVAVSSGCNFPEVNSQLLIGPENTRPLILTNHKPGNSCDGW